MIIVKNNSLFIKQGNKETPIFNEGNLEFCYTKKNEDITKRYIDSFAQYTSYKQSIPSNDFQLSAFSLENGIRINVKLNSDKYSSWGINLPFNFMGKLNGGGYQNQYLFNSSYRDELDENKYFYLSNPNGQNLLVLPVKGCAGWKVGYSTFCGGHFFKSVEVLGSFDKYYGESKNEELELYIFEVSNFNEALKLVSKYLDKPVLYYQESGGHIGKEIDVFVLGECDSVSDGNKTYKVNGNKFKYTINSEGTIHLVPYKGKIKGLECTLYGYKDIQSLYKKTTEAISFDDINVTDRNLCEHQCFISATLRYLLKYGKNEQFEEIVKKGLSYIMIKDPKDAVVRLTVLDKPYKDYPAYHIFESKRIQEQFFGVTIMLDAYRYFKEEIYLRYATGMMNTLIDCYQKEDGGFYTKMDWNEFPDDYSTVTCLILPLIDITLFIKDKDEKLYNKCLTASKKLAEHVYQRGLNFPTETLVSDEHEPEMEDGSISCSALTLLYYSTHIEHNDVYIKKAKEILELHEAWVVQTPLCNTYRSSLRWWETIWEGDADGPAVCYGHAWTIWRAEADYWMYVATNDEKYLLKATNSFNTNFAKIHEDGSSYSMYCLDYFNGGGRLGQPKFKLSSRYPDQKDSGLTRYVWIRAYESILNILK